MRWNVGVMRGSGPASALASREDFLATEPTLPIHDLEQRHVGLTKAIADSYTEAATVCLDRRHRSPISFELARDRSQSTAITAIVEWVSPDERTRRAWMNETDATEAGAYACVLAAVELVDDLVAVRRAETLTGVDYYVASKDNPPDDLESCLRLEVSGSDRGSEGRIRQRLREKLHQAETGHSNLPALAGVVGFRVRLILLADLRV